MTQKRLLTVSEFAEAINVHPQTVRDWDRSGKVRAEARTPGGQRRYTEKQVEEYFRSIRETGKPDTVS